MKDRRRRDSPIWNRFCRCSRFFVLVCALFFAVTFSTFRLFGVSFRPVLLPSGRSGGSKAVANVHDGDQGIFIPRRIFRQRSLLFIEEAIAFPDQILLFLRLLPESAPSKLLDRQCVYYSPRSSDPDLILPVISIEGESHLHEIVRCPLPQTRYSKISVRPELQPVPLSEHWQSLAYKALIDIDNTTVVFVKGLNLRAEKLANASRFECVYGSGFSRGRFLRSRAVSVAQEIVRCSTPLVLVQSRHSLTSRRVSVNIKGRGIFRSVAWPEILPESGGRDSRFTMCICTMVRNQAKFLREWIMYHARVGVQRWLIYDNNSDDAIEEVVESLGLLGLNVTRHGWPWIKTQEAGFAHCALRARSSCEWVGFIDVDEFLYFPSNQTLRDVLANNSLPSVGELRTSCLSFGPSGLNRHPQQGVTVGYTCRMAAPERHKSIIRPDTINSTLVNVVHHFHLAQGYRYVNIDRSVMVINHYKYQVWDVFKEKFYRRVATYVSDWHENENEGSKDRAPGLGTEAIEPPDWSSRFCEVTDSGLRNWVLHEIIDQQTHLLPWEIELADSVT